MLRNICRSEKWPMGMVTAFFMLTVVVSTVLAVTVSQQAAYLWLSFILIGVLFVTTFTRTNRAIPIFDSTARRREPDPRSNESSIPPPYCVRIDPPPSYNAVTSTTVTIYPDTSDPPPYINVVIQNLNPPMSTMSDDVTTPHSSIPCNYEPLEVRSLHSSLSQNGMPVIQKTTIDNPEPSSQNIQKRTSEEFKTELPTGQIKDLNSNQYLPIIFEPENIECQNVASNMTT